MSKIKYLALAFFVVLVLMKCSEEDYTKLEGVSKANLKKVDFEELEGFYDDNLTLAFDVFKKDCVKSKRYDLFKEVCKRVPHYEGTPEKFFTQNFQAYKLIGNDFEEEGLITGYYEPLLYGSRTKSEKYKYPVYKVPKDLLIVDLRDAYPELKKYRLRGMVKGNKVVALPPRSEIEKLNLEPICYVDNKVDLFFLEIQGSGRVQLDSGEVINVGYGNQNGRAYYAIGRKLIEDGHIAKKDISLQSIKKWLEANPSKADEIMNLNESYVFFREAKRRATGSLNTELVAKRNLAVDRKYIPLGMPVFINTTNPISKDEINQLMVAADTGGAIKGEIRADFFWGSSKEAEDLAGKMKQKGELYILVPKE